MSCLIDDSLKQYKLKKSKVNLNLTYNILPEHEKHLRLIAQAATDLNIPAYLVGGYVRDLILKRPCKDIDVVCVGSGIELAKASAKKFKNSSKVSVYKNFGTAAFRIGDLDFEFVGARKESYQRNSRKPIVENGTLEDDQNRRDFTINALSLSLNQPDFGSLLDSFNGLRDLENGIIRTPLDPNITFSDDPLRMMRAIRFATQLNFKIKESTFTAIVENGERLKIISKERIADELNKIMRSPKPSIGIELLSKSKLLQFILPEIEGLRGVEECMGKSHKDNYYHTAESAGTTYAKPAMICGFVGRHCCTMLPNHTPNALIESKAGPSTVTKWWEHVGCPAFLED